MTSEQFSLWLTKYLARIKGESNGLSANQVKTIKRKLKTVVITAILLLFASPAFGQNWFSPELPQMYDDNYMAKHAVIEQAESVKDVRNEIKELKQEITLLRQLLGKLLAKMPDPEPATHKVWRQVRPENWFDDGWELVEEPIHKRELQTCPACSGVGQLFSNGQYSTCPACHGIGKL